MVDFRFGILGSLEILVEGSTVTVSAGKQRVVLAALLLSANRVVSVERLVDAVWEETPPANARNALQTYVMRLRRLLGGSADGPVFTASAGYGIEVAEDELDLDRFTNLVRQGRAALADGDTTDALDLLSRGLDLWRGQPLSDVPSEMLRRQVVPALTEQWLTAVESRIEAHLILGRHTEVLAELQELTAQYSLRERLWAQQMRALYLSGRQAEALECYRTISGLLVEELGVDPGQELRDVHQQVLRANPAPAPPLRVSTIRENVSEKVSSIPGEVTSFVGRQVELAACRKALQAERLVTLTGVGGVGKTRLALRLAAAVEESHPGWVCLVDLAPLTDSEHVGRLVAEAAGIHDQSMRPAVHVLVEHLKHQRLLLVLDNCEHLVSAVADLVAALLPAIPELRVLATSRQALGLIGEHLLRVPPLPIPSTHDVVTGDSAALARYDAVRLLADRAACSSNVDILRADPHAVAELCRHLDGIPLAIELAAIRLASMSIHEVIDRLQDRFRLFSGAGARITPAYHQTLHAVIDWSHDLCTEPEQQLWARLSVFAGEFDLEAAETVCEGESITRHNVMDLIAALVSKSILSAHNYGAITRYRLLETIRQYGRQRLRDHREDLLVRRRHRDYYQKMAENAVAGAGWCGDRMRWWIDRLHQDLPNLRAALDFCVAEPGQADAGLDIAHNLTHARAWWFCGALGEGRNWIERTLALQTGPPHPSHVAAQAQAAWIAICQGDPTAATALFNDAKATADRLSMPDLQPILGFVEGAHALLIESTPAAIPLLARAKEEFRQRNQTNDHYMATLMWTLAAALLADTSEADAATSEFLTLAETQPTDWGWAHWCRGLAELNHGEPHQALAFFCAALRSQGDTNDHWGPSWFVETLAWATAAAGDHHQAATLLGTAQRMRHLTGLTITGLRPLHEHHVQTQEHLQQALGTHAYDAAHRKGATVPTYRDAVVSAIGE